MICCLGVKLVKSFQSLSSFSPKHRWFYRYFTNVFAYRCHLPCSETEAELQVGIGLGTLVDLLIGRADVGAVEVVGGANLHGYPQMF